MRRFNIFDAWPRIFIVLFSYTELLLRIRKHKSISMRQIDCSQMCNECEWVIWGNQKLWIGEILKERQSWRERQEMCLCRDLEGLGYGYGYGLRIRMQWWSRVRLRLRIRMLHSESEFELSSSEGVGSLAREQGPRIITAYLIVLDLLPDPHPDPAFDWEFAFDLNPDPNKVGKGNQMKSPSASIHNTEFTTKVGWSGVTVSSDSHCIICVCVCVL